MEMIRNHSPAAHIEQFEELSEKSAVAGKKNLISHVAGAYLGMARFLMNFNFSILEFGIRHFSRGQPNGQGNNSDVLAVMTSVRLRLAGKDAEAAEAMNGIMERLLGPNYKERLANPTRQEQIDFEKGCSRIRSEARSMVSQLLGTQINPSPPIREHDIPAHNYALPEPAVPDKALLQELHAREEHDERVASEGMHAVNNSPASPPHP